MRWRTLLALLAGVLLAHWTVLFGQLNAITMATSSARSMNTRMVDAALPAAPPVVATNAPAAKLPPPAAIPKPKAAAKPPKFIPIKPVVQENTAQPAIENVAIASPINPPDAPPSAPKLAEPELVSTVPSPPATPTTELPLDAQITSAQPLRESAAQGAAQEFAFPAAGRFEFNAIQTKGAQTQTAFGTLDWATDGNTYQLQLESKAAIFSVFRQTSVGRLSANGLQPERFSDKRFNRSERATHFQRDKGIISFANNKPNAPLLSGAQDQLSMMLQLSGIVGGNPAQAQAQRSIQLQVASTDEADLWVFSVEGVQTIVLPAGTTTALHLVRAPRKEFDRRVELWLAPSLDYMPVRLKQTEQNGDTLDLLLRSPSVRMPEVSVNCAATQTC